LPPAGEFRKGADPIRIDLGDVPPGLLDRLFVWIDEIDVTQFARVEGSLVTIELSAPLAGGAHKVDLAEFTNGEIIVHGTWTLDVRQTKHFEVAYLEANVAQMETYSAADGGIDRRPDRFQTNGAGEIAVGLANGPFRVDGYAPFLWNSQEELLGNHHGEIGSWIVAGTAGPATLRAGHQSLGHRTMALDMTERRGVSLALASERLRSTLTGFSLHGSRIAGFDENLGIDDDDDRISGGQLHTRLVESGLATFDVTAVGLTGRSPEAGSVPADLSGVAGDVNALSATSWSVRGQGAFFDGRIEALGEYAWSKWDFAGGGDAQKDEAYFVNITTTPLPELQLGERPVFWQLLFNRSRVGTFFYSPGNPGYPGDREETAGGMNLYWAGLSLAAEGGTFYDDVKDIDVRPRMSVDSWSALGSFTPAELLGGERRGALRWLGMPTLNGSYAWEDVEPDAIPTGYTGELPDKLTQNGYVELSFGYDTWSWWVGHTIIDSNDRTNLDWSSRSNRTEVSAYLPLRGYVTLSPSVQAEWVKHDHASDSTNIRVGMTVDGTAIPDRLEGFVSASYVRLFTNDHSVDEHTVDVTGQINWTAVKAENNLPGLTFSVLGAYQGVDDAAVRSADHDIFQVFLRATVDWPIAFGGR